MFEVGDFIRIKHNCTSSQWVYSGMIGTIKRMVDSSECVVSLSSDSKKRLNKGWRDEPYIDTKLLEKIGGSVILPTE